MSLHISLTSEHLITTLILWWVQMGVPNGTSADWRAAPIGWLWLSGRWSRVIILPLGGDVLTYYLAHSSPPLFFHFFFAPCLHIQPFISQLQLPPALVFLICHFLLLGSLVWWTQGAIVSQTTDFTQMTVGGSNARVLPDAAWWRQRQAMSTAVISM